MQKLLLYFMKKIIIRSLLAICLISSNIFSVNAETKRKGVSIKRPHNVKLNLFALPLRNFSLQYEYAFHKNMSGALGARLMLPYSIDLSDQFNSDDNFEAKLGKFKFIGYALTPEFRFYPGKKQKHQAPHGFYIAPYARFTNFTINTTVTIPSEPALLFAGGPVDTRINYTGFGGGLMFGAQWVFKNGISLDWWITGAHYGYSKVKVTAEADLIGQVNGAVNVIGSLDDLVVNEDLPFKNAESNFTTVGETISGNIKGIPFSGFRSGLCIGYTF